MSFSSLSFIFLFGFLPFSICYNFNAFYGNWEAYHDYPICKIPGDKISRLFYDSFLHSGCTFVDEYLEIQKAGPADGVCGSPPQNYLDPLQGNMYQLMLLKQRYPGLKVIANVAGSVEMHTAMLSSSLSNAWIQGCVQKLTTFNTVFDGINLDLEYPCLPSDTNCGGSLPSADDKTAFTNFVKLFKNSMKAGSYLSLSISMDPLKQLAIDFAALDPYVNEYHVMTYGAAGAWSAHTGHYSPPYSNPDDLDFALRGQLDVQQAVQSLLNLGVIASKIYLATVFYGIGFKVATGPYYTPFLDNQGPLSFGTYGIPNTFYYWDLKANYLTVFPDFVHWDEVSNAPIYVDENQGIAISYDDPRSISEKIAIVQSLGLGGLFAWELGMDTQDYELLNTASPFPEPDTPLAISPITISYPSNHYQEHWLGLVQVATFDAWSNGFRLIFKMTNPSTRVAHGYVFTIKWCSTTMGTEFTSIWGYQDYSISVSGNLYTMTFTSLPATYIAPGQTGFDLGGFCMKATSLKTRIQIDAGFLYGLDLYASKISTSAAKAELFCGNTLCFKPQMSGTPNCGLNCKSILKCLTG